MCQLGTNKRSLLMKIFVALPLTCEIEEKTQS